MVDAVRHLIDAGRIKLFCVDSLDAWSLVGQRLPIEERARRARPTTPGWSDQVVPWIADSSGGRRA